MKVVTFTQFMDNTCHIARTCEAFGHQLYARHFDNQHRRRARLPRESIYPVLPMDLPEVEKLAAAGWTIVALQEGGVRPDAFEWDERTILLVGRETGGIPLSWQHRIHHSIWIPMYGNVRCLNAADAAVIVMYEATKALHIPEGRTGGR